MWKCFYARQEHYGNSVLATTPLPFYSDRLEGPLSRKIYRSRLAAEVDGDRQVWYCTYWEEIYAVRMLFVIDLIFAMELLLANSLGHASQNVSPRTRSCLPCHVIEC